ncbi:MAG TPA: SRPBCC family protein [Candidatus Eisenbacteria bacterium]|nr:SRPBCC family protein [Candidatus Eisenbacteria bacterium]
MKEKTEFVYVTYIASTPEKVFDALIAPEMTRKYWAHLNVSDWKAGSAWKHENAENGNTDLVGKVIEIDRPRRLVISWAFPGDQDNPAKHSRVTFLVQPGANAVRLTVMHEDLEAGSDMEKGIRRGWPVVLSNLKTLLETGSAIETRELFALSKQ